MRDELCWIDGRVVPLAEAAVSVEDRGYQFADGVYEVVRFYAGRPFELEAHLDRLARSCAGIDMSPPMSHDALGVELLKYAGTIKLTDATIYLQITRGTASRNHVYVGRDLAAHLLFYGRPSAPMGPVAESPGVALHAVPDERWGRCWIKAIALLPNVLAKNAAVRAGADEAVFVTDRNIVPECATSNLFAVIGGRLVTHPVGPRVLPGVTRGVVIRCAAELGMHVEERAFTEAEALAADELFITSTTREIAWVSTWSGRRIASGGCGDVTSRLHQAFQVTVPKPEMKHEGTTSRSNARTTGAAS